MASNRSICVAVAVMSTVLLIASIPSSRLRDNQSSIAAEQLSAHDRTLQLEEAEGSDATPTSPPPPTPPTRPKGPNTGTGKPKGSGKEPSSPPPDNPSGRWAAKGTEGEKKDKKAPKKTASPSPPPMEGGRWDEKGNKKVVKEKKKEGKEKKKEKKKGEKKEGKTSNTKEGKKEKEKEKKEGKTEKKKGAGAGNKKVVAKDGERYLLIPSTPLGFASGIATQVLPFLMLAAKVNRTAVLPPAQIGIPAFRSTGDPSFLPLEEFLDMEKLSAAIPCIRYISYAQWAERTGRTISTLVQIGLPVEVGTASTPGNADGDPKLPDIKHNCIAEVSSTATRVKERKEFTTFWAGPFGFAKELLYLHGTEGWEIKNRECISIHASRLSSSFDLVKDAKSVMIYNVPGMIKGAFGFGGGFMRKGTGSKLYNDVERTDLCPTADSQGYPSYRHWPDLSPHWGELSSLFRKKAFGSATAPFTCVQIRFEKMLLKAQQAGRIGPLAKLSKKDPYLKKCVDGMLAVIKAKVTGPVFLASDLDAETGSASAARAGGTSAYMGTVHTALKTRFTKAKTFCSSKEHKDIKSGKFEGVSPRVTQVLSVFEGNCAIPEAAICRAAKVKIRFGMGFMGNFIVGNDKEARTWYQTCADIIDESPYVGE